MMGKFNTILLVIGLSVWITLYSLWYILDQSILYFIGQSIMMLIASFVLAREFKWTIITTTFFLLCVNQFIDEIFLFGQEFRWSEYGFIIIAIIITYKKFTTKKLL